MIIGGAQLYKYALPLVDRIYLTKVGAAFEDADTFFPQVDRNEWTLGFSEWHDADDRHIYNFEFQILERNRLS